MPTASSPRQIPGRTAATLPALRPRRKLLATALLVSLLSLMLTGVLSGCEGLRWETAPPPEPVPDSLELVRRTTAANVLHIAETADQALASDLPEAQRHQVERILADAEAHLAAMGGVYVSGLIPAPNPANPAIPAPAAPVTATSYDVISALVAAASENRLVANEVAEGSLARLLASIGASQAVAAAELRFQMEGDTALVDPGLNLPLGTFPGETLPAGISISEFQAAVSSDDAARFAYEVAAARNEGDIRAMMRELARMHGRRGQVWAELGNLAGTDQDPRQVAYQVPEGLTPAELVLYVETELSLLWSSLIASAAQSTRQSLIDLFLETRLMTRQWGGTPVTFPGMPEIETEFGGAPDLPNNPRIPTIWIPTIEDATPTE